MRSDKVFDFVVRYLAPLKFIPLLPHVFDGLLRMRVLLFKPALLDWIDELETDMESIDGVTLSVHKYGGLQFNYRGIEIGHLHSNGLLDILYARIVKENLKHGGRLTDHHVFHKSGWTSFYLRSSADVSYAKELLILAFRQGGRCLPQ